MKRIFRWLVFIATGITIFCVIGVIIIQLYKSEILAAVNEKLKETFNGDVNIGDYNLTVFHNFPNISITLTDIYLHGPAYSQYHRPFLQAQRIDVNVEPLKLFNKNISIKSVDIENGKIFVFRTAAGYTNMEIFKHREIKDSDTSKRNTLPELNEINLLNVLFTYQDSLKHKNFGIHFLKTTNSVTSTKDSTLLLHIGGKLKFDELLLNQLKGSFLKDKYVTADLNIEIDRVERQLLIFPSTLVFEKSRVKLSGGFQLAAPAGFNLDIQSDKMDYSEGLSILPDTLAKKIGKYQVNKPIKLNVKVKGVLEPGVQPAVDVRFSFENSDVTAGKILMENMSMTGIFINHVDEALVYNDHNSQLHFTSIDGLLDNLPVKAVATLTDLTDPSLDLKATFDLNLKSINEHLDTLKLKLAEGHFVSTFSYSGKLMEYLDNNRTRYEGKLQGEAKITNGRLQYFTKKITVDKINAVFTFTEKKFDINNLALRLNKNKISIKGFITDFIPFFTTPATTGKANLRISSPYLDITGLLQPRKTERTKIAKAASKKKFAGLVEKLNEKIEFDLDFNVAKFKNKNFEATKVTGNIVLENNRFLMKKATMDFGKGKVTLDLKVSDLHKPVNPLELRAEVQHVELKDFFYGFNNFKQSTFRHEHVQGHLTMNMSMTAQINDNLDLLTPTMKGDIQFKIREGRLRDFEPMERLSNFLFKNRDFSDVQFAEVFSTIKMNGTKMELSRMEIESTMLTMFIEGRYDLKDSTDLSIQIPLSNLKKRGQDFAPENVGTDTKAGASVFLRVRPDKNGKTTISYDPFKKLRKKKKNADAL